MSRRTLGCRIVSSMLLAMVWAVGGAVICCVANSCWAAEKTPLTPKYTILFREIELPYAVGCGSSLVVFDQISDKVRLFDIATRKVCSASIGERVRLHGVAASQDGTRLFVAVGHAPATFFRFGT